MGKLFSGDIVLAKSWRRRSVPDNCPIGIPVYVCQLFEELSFEALAAGFPRYSADAILHRIRWHFHIERGDRQFKANNNWTSTLSRWCMARNHKLRGFFEIRALRHERNWQEGDDDRMD